MPRQPRLIVPDVAVHIRHRGNDGQDCFRDENDRLVYLANLYELCRTTGCALHAYCLMTNHVHLLATPADESGCATLMRQLGQRYVQYFNRRYRRTGTLWEGRFRSCLVESREHVLSCYRYVEMNPVRAGMVTSPGEYRWSSHAANVGLTDNSSSLRPHCEYLALGDDTVKRHAAYARMFGEDVDARYLKTIRAATNGGYALIGDALKARLASNVRHRLEPGKAGRPADEARNPDGMSLELGL
jgi:putative transposase